MRVAKAVGRDTFPGPERIAMATRASTAWQAQMRRSASAGDPSRRSVFLLTVAWSAGALTILALVLACTLTFYRLQSIPRPMNIDQARTIAVAVEGAEQTWAAGPCHQKLTVRMTSRFSQELVGDRLELWSDRGQRRFAVEWRDQSGRLEGAAWNPGSHRSYRLYPNTHAVTSGSEARAKTEPLLSSITRVQFDGSAADLQHFEEQLIRYFTRSRLKPISLSEDFMEFAGRDALTVRVESMPPAAGAFRLFASRRVKDVRAELVLEVNARTLNATSLRLTVRQGRQAIEAWIRIDRIEPLVDRDISLATFEPKLVEGNLTEAHRAVSKPPVVGARTLASVEIPFEPGQDLGEREIDIYYALHRIGACLGDPLSVERLPSGKFAVAGMVQSEEVKENILTILGNFSGIEAKVTTVAEAVRQRTVQASGSRPSTSIELHVDNSSYPVRTRLQAYFATAPNLQTRSRAIANLSNRAISLSSSGLAQAWAIRRLREKFPSGYPDPLGLIEQMMADHTKAFRARVLELRAVLQPILPSSAIFPSGAPTLLEAAKSIDGLVRSIFSSQTPETSLDPNLQQLSGWLTTTERFDFAEREP